MAADLAEAAELLGRAVGLMATAPPNGLARELIARGRALAGGNITSESRLLTAEAYTGDDLDPVTAELAERAIVLARRAGDPLAETVALDELTAVQLARGELRAALASALRRTEILGTLPVTALSGLEHSDSLQMAAECAIATGDLRTARQLAERVRDLPFHREESHLATARLIVVAALAGDWDEALVLAGQFREGWERAGRPRAGNLSRGAYAAATVHGLRGDDDARAAWLEIVDALATLGLPLGRFHFDEFFDALLLLHRGKGEAAMRLLLAPPEEFRTWASGMWRPWYAALWAEAAVVTGHPDAAARIRRARLATWDNPVAAAIVARAGALIGERDGLAPAAAVRLLLGAVISGPDARDHRRGGARRGEAELAAMGATVMAGLQDEVERGPSRPAHAAEARLAQHGAPSRRSPACAPSPRPTSWSRAPGGRSPWTGRSRSARPDSGSPRARRRPAAPPAAACRPAPAPGARAGPPPPGRPRRAGARTCTPGRSRCPGVPWRERSRTWSAGPLLSPPPPGARRRSRPRALSHAEEGRAAEGLRHDDRGGTEPAADIGHARPGPQLVRHPVQRGEPRVHQVGGVAGAESRSTPENSRSSCSCQPTPAPVRNASVNTAVVGANRTR